MIRLVGRPPTFQSPSPPSRPANEDPEEGVPAVQYLNRNCWSSAKRRHAHPRRARCTPRNVGATIHAELTGATAPPRTRSGMTDSASGRGARRYSPASRGSSPTPAPSRPTSAGDQRPRHQHAGQSIRSSQWRSRRSSAMPPNTTPRSRAARACSAILIAAAGAVAELITGVGDRSRTAGCRRRSTAQTHRSGLRLPRLPC